MIFKLAIIPDEIKSENFQATTNIVLCGVKLIN